MEGKENSPAVIADLLERLILQQQVNCFNCEHVDVEGNICRKFGTQPPLKIIAKGCPHFSRTIPF